MRALRDGGDQGDHREDNRLGEDEWLGALRAALERAALITCDHLSWIAARDAPAALRADTAGLGTWLADALADALYAAASDAALLEPFCLQVSGGVDDEPRLPPTALLADDRWRLGVTAHSQGERAAIDHL